MSKHREVICYEESTDGINFEKPSLGLTYKCQRNRFGDDTIPICI